MFGTYQRLGVHVYAKPREVIRAARKKITPSSLYSRQFRDGRHAYYRAMLRHHKDARDLVNTFRL